MQSAKLAFCNSVSVVPTARTTTTPPAVSRSANVRSSASSFCNRPVFNHPYSTTSSTAPAPMGGVSMTSWKERSERRAKSITPFKNFLTQRAIQTLATYSREFLDETSAEFVEEFGGHSGLHAYQGYKFMKMDWNEYLISMVSAPTETYTIKKNNPYRGGTPGNPYIKETFLSYKVVVDPSKIATRLMECREHIANEFHQDLGLIGQESLEIVRHHRAMVTHKKDDQGALQMAIFDHDPLHNTSSPKRAGTYELLKRMLAVYAYREVVAARKAAAEAGIDRAAEAEAAWLERMFAEHGTPLEGSSHRYGMGKEFVEKVLNSSPRIVGGIDGVEPALVDPSKLAMMMLKEMEALAECWQDAVMPGLTEEDHLNLRRTLLEDKVKVEVEVEGE